MRTRAGVHTTYIHMSILREITSERSWCLFPTNINRPECAFLFITLRLCLEVFVALVCTHCTPAYFVHSSSCFFIIMIRAFSISHSPSLNLSQPQTSFSWNYWDAFHCGNQWAERERCSSLFYFILCVYLCEWASVSVYVRPNVNSHLCFQSNVL